MARPVYDAPHAVLPWGWKVGAYLWTKSIAAGSLLLAALGVLLGGATGGLPSWPQAPAAPLLALVFLALTTVLLVGDLKRPDRFFFLLTRATRARGSSSADGFSWPMARSAPCGSAPS